jgi:hypothetical protein
MAISLNLKELSEKFEIYAKISEAAEPMPFRKNMEVYSFQIKRKNSNLDL